MKQADQPADGARGGSGGRDGHGGRGAGGGRGVDVVAALAAIEAQVAALAPDLAPEAVPGHRVAAVVRGLSAVERRVRGLRLVLRQAAADSGGWKASGARSAAEHVAKEEGISVGQARAELAASARLAGQAEAREAVASGAISVEKAKAVAEGASADPTAERSLVAAARSGDLRATQDAARTAVVRADERAGGQRALRAHRRRSLSTWLTVDGEGHGHWNVPAEAHHRFLAALEPYRAQVFRDARTNGVRLTDEQMMADALDLLARDVLLDHQPLGPDPTDNPTATATATATASTGPTGTGGPDDAGPPAAGLFGDDGPAPPGPPSAGPAHDAPSPDPARDAAPDTATGPAPDTATGPAPAPAMPPRRGRHRKAPTQVMVLVDHAALVRGHATDGETCEVTGLGPVPVALVRHMMNDCLLRLVLTGTDVTTIATHRRYVPADLRAALWARDHGTCVVPGCHATRGLEIDHCHTDFARGGPTSLANLALLCRPHHTLKTLAGWALTGTPTGGWAFTPPATGATTDDEPP